MFGENIWSEKYLSCIQSFLFIYFFWFPVLACASGTYNERKGFDCTGKSSSDIRYGSFLLLFLTFEWIHALTWHWIQIGINDAWKAIGELCLFELLYIFSDTIRATKCVRILRQWKLGCLNLAASWDHWNSNQRVVWYILSNVLRIFWYWLWRPNV